MMMTTNTACAEQYVIYIGYTDAQTGKQFVTVDEFAEMVTSYFKRKDVAFSVSHCRGGYVYQTGQYASEHTMMVNLIGAQGLDIYALAKGLSMFMNQEHVLVTRTVTETRYITDGK